MKTKNLCAILAAFAISASAYAETRTVDFSLSPQMTCANCEKKIKSNLRFEKGVQKIETSIKDKKVTVTYNSDKTSPEALEAAFKKIGYTATEIDASTSASTPSSTRQKSK